ncbi:MAG: polyisoprenoid-binding protein YceI [Paraglaciecola sp.]|jgi:polyisoprenoid-binding protein YceI
MTKMTLPIACSMIAMLICSTSFSQKLIDKSATITFFSEAPMENIAATNSDAQGVIDMETGTVAVSMYMSRFKFEKSLMQEHFNENYVESEKFPKATFTGNITDFDKRQIKKIDQDLSYPVMGKMTMHGVTNDFEGEVKFSKEGNSLKAVTEFTISIADYDVDIPKMVIMNIAEEVLVTAIFNFEMP